MKNFKKAWSLVVQNKRTAASLIGIKVINGLVLGILAALTGLVNDGPLSVILKIVMLIAGIALTYITLISSLHLLKQCIFQQKKISFAQMYGEFFHYAKDNWKNYCSLFAIWNILVPIAIVIAAAVIAFPAFCMSGFALLEGMFTPIGFILGDGVLGFLGVSPVYPPDGWFTSIMLELFAGVAIIFCIFVLAVACSIAASYYAGYKISAAQDGKPDFAPVFSNCLALTAVLLILLAAIMCMGAFLSLDGRLLIVAVIILIMVYNCIVQVKIILDERDRGINDFTSLPDLPASSRSDYLNMPPLPGVQRKA